MRAMLSEFQVSYSVSMHAGLQQLDEQCVITSSLGSVYFTSFYGILVSAGLYSITWFPSSVLQQLGWLAVVAPIPCMQCFSQLCQLLWHFSFSMQLVLQWFSNMITTPGFSMSSRLVQYGSVSVMFSLVSQMSRLSVFFSLVIIWLQM